MCPNCSKKLNYHNKKKEVKRLQRKSIRQKNKNTKELNPSSSTSSKSLHEDKQNTDSNYDESNVASTDDLESPWDCHKPVETKTREEEMEDYLQDLLL